MSAKERYDPTDLFAPDVMLACQLFEKREPPCAPEMALMRGVLEGALEDLEHYHGRHFASAKYRAQAEKILADTRAWFASEDRSYLFHFEHICDVLGIEADKTRSTLRAKGLL